MKPILYVCAAALLLASCQMNNKPVSTGDDVIAKNKMGMQKFYDVVINKHDVSKLDSFVAPAFIDHSMPNPHSLPLDSLKQMFTMFLSWYPDQHITVNFMLADSDMVMAEYTQTGTNTGSIMGMPPTGKSVTLHGVDIVKLDKSGKATEHWGYYEERKEIEQLGGVITWPSDESKKDMKKKK